MILIPASLIWCKSIVYIIHIEIEIVSAIVMPPGSNTKSSLESVSQKRAVSPSRSHNAVVKLSGHSMWSIEWSIVDGSRPYYFKVFKTHDQKI